MSGSLRAPGPAERSALGELQDRRAADVVHRHRAPADPEGTDTAEQLQVSGLGAVLGVPAQLLRHGYRTEGDLASLRLIGSVVPVAARVAADRRAVEPGVHAHPDDLGLTSDRRHLRQDPAHALEVGRVLLGRAFVVPPAGGKSEREDDEGKQDPGPGGPHAVRSCRWRLGDSFTGTSVGFTLVRTTSSSITHLLTSWREGSSYIVLSRTSSMIARSPRAPVARRIA